MAALLRIVFLFGITYAVSSVDLLKSSNDWYFAAGAVLPQCYVGVKSDSINNGQLTPCNGYCASARSFVGTINTTAFFCLDPNICTALNIYNNCSAEIPLNVEKEISACCCLGDKCNLQLYPSISPSTPQPVDDPPIACYSGVWINGTQPVDGSENVVACQGDCVSIGMNYTSGGSATFYTCDPSTYCRSQNISGTCANIEPGMEGCCCNTDVCINPQKNLKPTLPLKCYAGISIPSDNYTIGDIVNCTGAGAKCLSVNTVVGGKNATVYQCVIKTVCEAGLNITGTGTNTFQNGGQPVNAYCCDDKPLCNGQGQNLNFIGVTMNGPKIACWSGFSINGKFPGNPGWINCNGDCMSIQWLMGSDTMTLYGCDPVQFISALGIDNACGYVDNDQSMKACSCDQNGCLDGTDNVPKTTNAGLTCYVGVQSDYMSNNASLSVGNTVYCDGRCGSLNANVSNINTTIFFCADVSICNAYKLANQCGPLNVDKEITACCCDSSNNCNVKLASYSGKTIIPPPVQDPTDPPIACFSGVYMNGNLTTSGKFVECNGDCVSLQLNTTLAGANHTTTIYTCDPSSVCTALNIMGTCTDIEPGLTGCCCNTDVCINPKTGVNPSLPLQCDAGIWQNGNNISYIDGDVVDCQNGMCASINTIVNNNTVKVYQCVQKSVCTDGFGIFGTGSNTFNNAGQKVTVYCCDSPRCASQNDPVKDSFKGVTPTGDPIACFNGFYQNGMPKGNATWNNCRGDCMSLTWKTSASNDTMTLYGCDPVQFIADLGIDNACSNINGMEGLRACSCSKSACLDGRSPTPNTTPNNLTCYVGIQSADSSNITTGATVYCNGRCGSARTTVSGGDVTVFFCMDINICNSFGLANSCADLAIEKDINACCCDFANNCNVRQRKMDINMPAVQNITDPPIACYSGVSINGSSVTQGNFIACQGDCVSIQLDTKVNNVFHSTIVYSCDPSTLCRSLDILGKCNTLEAGLTGCCCSSDVCIDPSKGMVVATAPPPPQTTTSTALRSALWTVFSFVLLITVYRK